MLFLVPDSFDVPVENVAERSGQDDIDIELLEFHVAAGEEIELVDDEFLLVDGEDRPVLENSDSDSKFSDDPVPPEAVGEFLADFPTSDAEDKSGDEFPKDSFPPGNVEDLLAEFFVFNFEDASGDKPKGKLVNLVRFRAPSPSN